MSKMTDIQKIKLLGFIGLVFVGLIGVAGAVRAGNSWNLDSAIPRIMNAIHDLQSQITENVLYAKTIDAKASDLQNNVPVKIFIRHLQDDAAGNAAGWNPDGVNAAFIILDGVVNEFSVLSLTVNDGGGSSSDCHLVVWGEDAGQIVGFKMLCDGSIYNGATLNYTVTNPVD
jgi:hypothetical protein